MKVHYDEKADAIYFRFDQSDIQESEEVRPGVVMDFNAQGQVVGIEILGAKKRIPKPELRNMQFEIA